MTDKMSGPSSIPTNRFPDGTSASSPAMLVEQRHAAIKMMGTKVNRITGDSERRYAFFENDALRSQYMSARDRGEPERTGDLIEGRLEIERESLG